MDLREAVTTRARIDGDLLMVDEFLNHRIDPSLMTTLGRDVASLLHAAAPDVLLTAEASGIPVALLAALHMGIPMIYAKKYVGTGDRYSFAREVASPTKGIEYRVEVSRRVLAPGSRIGIVDDFLARGRTAEALGQIAEEAGCDVVGCVFAIEKAYEDGRSLLESHGWDVSAVVRVASLNNGVVRLV